MFIPFDSMPGHSRLWIYQANRTFTAIDKQHFHQGLRDLCEQWSAHGTPLHTSFTLQFDLFVILAVDEHQQGASGCSIDGSVRYLKSVQSQLGLDFFDRTQTAFLVNGKIAIYPIQELKTLFENNTLSEVSIAFNNAISTKSEWETHWKVTAKNSWLKRYLPQTPVAG